MKNLILSSLLFLLILNGCSKKEELEITSISFESAQVEILEEESIDLLVIHTPSELAAPGYTWVSLSPDIVTVDNGIAKGIRAGMAKIKVTAITNQSLTATCTVIVKIAGTAENPYEINSKQDLMLMRDRVNSDNDKYGNKVYKLMTDLDFINEPNWVPIGTFRGIFDGNGKVIKNMKIGTPTTIVDNYYAGLFGSVSGGEIYNLGVQWNCINTSLNAGGISAELDGGTIINCYTTGSITSGRNCGGISGTITGGTIKNCYSSASIFATGELVQAYAGGINGYFVSYNSLISNCIALNDTITAIDNTPHSGRIANFRSLDIGKNNYALSTLVVREGMSMSSLITITDFTNIIDHGENLIGSPQDFLNAYVTANPFYNDFTLSKWKVVAGENNGYPVFE